MYKYFYLDLYTDSCDSVALNERTAELYHKGELKMKKKNSMMQRVTATLLCLAMVLGVGIIFISPRVSAESKTEYTIRDDALHFIIRHWHTDDASDNNSQFQGDSAVTSVSGHYFVVVEGYIVPTDDGSYEFYFVYQTEVKDEDGNVIRKAGDLDKIDTNDSDYTDYGESAYIQSIDPDNGIITLNENAIVDDGVEMEKFSGFSISAGRGAVDLKDSKKGIISIKYDPSVHLVKGHVYYSSKRKIVVNGTDDELVFGEGTMWSDAEIDTAEIYTYIEDIEDEHGELLHQAGDIVMSDSDPSVVCTDENDLPSNSDNERLKVGVDVELTKFYCTSEGLHTDKTIVESSDGRIFAIDLEAWYTEGYAAQVGMILDASGSMAFASDVPKVINVFNMLGIKKTDGGYIDSDGEMIDESHELYSLTQKIGLLAEWGKFENGTETVKYRTEDLLGYYEFAQTSSGDKRTWFLNTVSGGDPAKYWTSSGNGNKAHFAKLVQHPNAGDDFNWEVSNQMTVIEYKDYNGAASWGGVPMKFANANGFCLNDSATAAAFLLESTPVSDNFTLSFSLNQVEDTIGQGDIEILYIGSLTGSTSDSNYFHVIRSGNDIVASMGQKTVLRLSNTFSGTAKHTITFVFNGDAVTTYLDGNMQGGSVSLPTTLSGKNIVFAPFADNNSHSGCFFLDNVYLYNTALTAVEIDELLLLEGKPLGDTVSRPIDVFLKDTDSELRHLLNPHHTDNSLLGVSGYSYCVYDFNSGTMEYVPLGYWGGYTKSVTGVSDTVGTSSDGSILGRVFNNSNNKAGWYYASPDSNWAMYDKLGTAKRLIGVVSNINGEDTVDLPDGHDEELEKGNTNNSYTPSGFTPTRFYIDENGNLRCFFSRSVENTNKPENSPIYCSYVYELADKDYVKTEALRRALGIFTTELLARSPESEVSAVRFSMDTNEMSGRNDRMPESNLDKLILLDWTNDPIEAAELMSLTRGDDNDNNKIGGAMSYTESANGIKQYNYGLTGGTYSWTGLQSFCNTLLPNDDDNFNKYLIIFTDGKDDTIDSNGGTKSKDLASKLKKEGYTIFTVMLAGGSVAKEGTNAANYTKAKEFLISLSGNSDTDLDTDGYDTETKKQYFFDADNVDALTKIFIDNILIQIAKELEGYTVQDYIDPRFDLESRVGTKVEVTSTTTDAKTGAETTTTFTRIVKSTETYVIRMKSNGKIDLVPTDEDGKVVTDAYGNEAIHAKLDLKNGTWVIEDGAVIIPDHILALERDSAGKCYLNLTLSDNTTDPDARNPHLYYDAHYDMYYLEWVDQTIPISSVGAGKLTVWNARIVLRAKDDFIGGNAILTNGNYANMNWVFHPNDVNTGQKKRGQKDRDDSNNKYDSTGIFLANRDEYSVDDNFGHDASSGTDDMYRVYAFKTVDGGYIKDTDIVIDYYPSKGFPRTTANVRLLPIKTNNLYNTMYMGEAIAPVLLLGDIEDEYITESYYLDYLKRYAYQRYLYQLSSRSGVVDDDTIADLNKPLMQLLTDWLQIDAIDVYEKEFSIPYMYLPSVEYADDGTVILNGSHTAETIHNNTGMSETNEKDVVGILTYRWERLDPKDPNDRNKNMDPVEVYVKKDTERVVYSLTLEYTPLLVGDTLSKLNSAAVGNEIRDGQIFAKYYIPIDGDREELSNSDWFDREFYVNGEPITNNSISTMALVPKDKDNKDYRPLIYDSGYKWNRNYKPEADTVQLENAPGDDPIYGDATFMNNVRTLTAFSTYTIDTVTGGIALELRVLIGELEEAIKAYTESGNAEKTFTLTSVRDFRDIPYIEQLKSSDTKWQDYGDEFDITFKFDFDEIGEKFSALKAEADKDPDGYVSIFAEIVEIKTTFGSGSTAGGTPEIVTLAISNNDKNLNNPSGLPIGTYEFNIDDINSALKTVLGDQFHFATVKDINDENDKFKSEYFADSVLGGLYKDGNGNPYEQRDKDGNILTKGDNDLFYEKDANEINDGTKGTERNIETYITEANTASDKQKVTFFVGTTSADFGDSDKYVAKRDVEGEYWNSTNGYTYSRLGMMQLSTGTARLTVREKGALANETFIYRIEGTTLGGKKVDIYITVNGGGLTTVDIMPGTYTVTEISDWSWKYDNVDTYDTLHTGTDDEKYTSGENGGDWDVTKSTWKVSKTTLRYTDDDPVKEHHDVTYVHKRNEKVWLGGENHLNNHFAGVAKPSVDD